MSKVVAAIVAGSGATVASVGGVYWIYYSGNAPTLSFTDLNTFKTATVADVECVKDFNGLASLNGDGSSVQTIDSTNNKIDNTFISSSDDATTAKGCLIVNGDRKEYSGSKGNGDFKLLGTFERGSNGFISALIAKQKEEGKLDLTGIFYALNKDSSNNGSIIKKKEVSTGKEIDSSNAENNFPKVGTALKTYGPDSDGWKMFTPTTDMQNICATNGDNCKTPTKTKTLRGYGTGKGASEGKQLDGWSGNLSNGGNNLYVTAEIDISTIASKQKGSWNKVAVNEKTST